MHPASLRIITDDPGRLVRFYEQMMNVSPQWATPDFAELVTPAFTLAIAHARTVAGLGAGVLRAADNHSTILEFRVPDVDQEYRRLEPILTELVLPPTTLPWGNRSLLFRDPDGHLINLFAPVSEAAIQRLNR